MYSKLGIIIWTDFWIAGSNFGQLSKFLHAADRASIDKVAGISFILYAKSKLFRLVLPWLTHYHPRLFRYKDETVSENKPILGGKLLAL